MYTRIYLAQTNILFGIRREAIDRMVVARGGGGFKLPYRCAINGAAGNGCYTAKCEELLVKPTTVPKTVQGLYRWSYTHLL